ncbi:hypothetical protein [Paenibacillus sp. GXUN7292]|uniref:hypothetical protein n=1 Tax=Paenibacillus sp. GXUN7292 TaxID=3422499 RepID=UPI003D7D58E5
MSKQERFDCMRAALQNILDISRCDFAKHQAAWGLGIKREAVDAQRQATDSVLELKDKK